MLKRYKRDGEIENALKPLETTYPITGDSCSETILSVNGCSLTLDYPIQGISHTGDTCKGYSISKA